MAQLSLFSRAEIAAMRDRTASRNYSAAKEAFRREHEEHRAWGLRQRHARKLVRLGWRASEAWAAVTDGDDQQCSASSQRATAAPACACVPRAAVEPFALSRERAGLFIVLAGWFALVVKVALGHAVGDQKGNGGRRIGREHFVMVAAEEIILSFHSCRRVGFLRGPPDFSSRTLVGKSVNWSCCFGW